MMEMLEPKPSCPECGYVGHCPHMDPNPTAGTANLVFNPVTNTVTRSSTSTAVADVFVANKIYEEQLCQSYDHKPAVQQMQAIRISMMRYFGSGTAGDVVLNPDWLETRRKASPGL